MQGSSPFPLSRQRAQYECPLKLAIAWPQLPLFCPGDDIIFYTLLEIKCDSKYENSYKKQTIIHKFLAIRKTLCALVRAKRKRCYNVTLSRQEGSTTRHLVSALVLGTSWPVETQDVFF